MSDAGRSRGSTASVSRPYRQRHQILCHAVLSLLLARSSSSSSNTCLVSAETLKPSYHRQHDLQSSITRSLERVQMYRRSRPRWEVHPCRTLLQRSLAAHVVFHLRCGGAENDEQTNTDGGEAIVAITQPMVDLSVVGSGDSSTSELDMTSRANASDSDIVCVQQEVDEMDRNIGSVNDDILLGGNNDSDDIPRDVESKGLVQEDIEPGFDESEIVTVPSDSTSSPQITTVHDKATHTTLMQSHRDLLSSASDQRAEGKTLHDSGNLANAALAFEKAALLLDEAIAMAIEFSVDEAADIDHDSIAVERATCRLHEALCLLKDGRPGECVEACTDVLRDGVRVVQMEGKVNDNDNTESDNQDTSKLMAGSVKIVTTPGRDDVTAHSRTMSIPPQIRARALHRRAKARLALDDLDGALDDARSAAFMGDRNAVQFYGRLMREGSGAGAMTSGAGSLAASGGLGAAFPSTANPFLEGILGGMSGNGNSPFMPAGAGSNDFSSSLLSSLLSSGNGNSSGGGSPLLGLVGDLLAPQPMVDGKKSGRGGRGKSKKGSGVDSLAKSILSSLMKRIEDEDTQQTICNYLHSTNTQQVMQYATMAGIPMKEGSARRLVTLANGVTPKSIRKSISNVKRGISIIKAVRKVFKVIEKYKYIIILTVTCYWIRSAIVEPYPVRKSKKQAQKLAQKAALSFILPSRDVRGSFFGVCSRMFLMIEGKFDHDHDDDDDDRVEVVRLYTTDIEKELEYLQNQLSWIDAIERNEAQLDSFIDENDQWNSLEEDEKLLLSSKDSIHKRIELLAKEFAER